MDPPRHRKTETFSSFARPPPTSTFAASTSSSPLHRRSPSASPSMMSAYASVPVPARDQIRDRDTPTSRPSVPAHQTAESLFRELDANGDGYVSFEEFSRWITSVPGFRHTTDLEYIRSMFNDIDINRDGRISLQELSNSHVEKLQNVGLELDTVVSERRSLLNQIEKKKAELDALSRSERLNEYGVAEGQSFLHIEILEARNLPARDLNGKSDPYCLVTVSNEPAGGQRKTKTIMENLNPVWNERIDIPMQIGTGDLTITVMDFDRFASDDFIGKLVIPLHSLRDEVTVDRWFQLTPELDGQTTDEHLGELHMRIFWQRTLTSALRRELDELTRKERDLERTEQSTQLMLNQISVHSAPFASINKYLHSSSLPGQLQPIQPVSDRSRSAKGVVLLSCISAPFVDVMQRSFEDNGYRVRVLPSVPTSIVNMSRNLEGVDIVVHNPVRESSASERTTTPVSNRLSGRDSLSRESANQVDRESSTGSSLAECEVLLNSCIESRVRHVVLLSSLSVYGDLRNMKYPIDELESQIMPDSRSALNYSVTEHFISHFARIQKMSSSGVSTVILRAPPLPPLPPAASQFDAYVSGEDVVSAVISIVNADSSSSSSSLSSSRSRASVQVFNVFSGHKESNNSSSNVSPFSSSAGSVLSCRRLMDLGWAPFDDRASTERRRREEEERRRREQQQDEEARWRQEEDRRRREKERERDRDREREREREEEEKRRRLRQQQEEEEAQEMERRRRREREEQERERERARLAAQQRAAEEEEERKRLEAAKSLPRPSTLYVTVAEARGLPKMDTIGSCDGYVKVMFAGQDYKTEIIKNTLNPKWNQTFQFQIPPLMIDSYQNRDAAVRFAIYDWDMIGSDEQIGSIQLPLFHQSAVKLPFESFVPIVAEAALGKSDAGSVLIRLYTDLDQHQIQQASPIPPTNQMQMTTFAASPERVSNLMCAEANCIAYNPSNQWIYVGDGTKLLVYNTSYQIVRQYDCGENIRAITPCVSSPLLCVLLMEYTGFAYIDLNTEHSIPLSNPEEAIAKNESQSNIYVHGLCDPKGRFIAGTGLSPSMILSLQMTPHMTQPSTMGNVWVLHHNLEIAHAIKNVDGVCGLAFYEKYLYLLDSKNSQIIRFDYDVTTATIGGGKVLCKLTESPSGSPPISMLVDGAGNIYIAFAEGGLLVKYRGADFCPVGSVSLSVQFVTAMAWAGDKCQEILVTSSKQLRDTFKPTVQPDSRNRFGPGAGAGAGSAVDSSAMAGAVLRVRLSDPLVRGPQITLFDDVKQTTSSRNRKSSQDFDDSTRGATADPLRNLPPPPNPRNSRSPSNQAMNRVSDLGMVGPGMNRMSLDRPSPYGAAAQGSNQHLSRDFGSMSGVDSMRESMARFGEFNSVTEKSSFGFSAPVPDRERTGFAPPVPDRERTGFAPPVPDRERTGFAPPVPDRERTGFAPPVPDRERTGFAPPVPDRERTGFAPPVPDRETLFGRSRNDFQPPSYQEAPSPTVGGFLQRPPPMADRGSSPNQSPPGRFSLNSVQFVPPSPQRTSSPMAGSGMNQFSSEEGFGRRESNMTSAPLQRPRYGYDAQTAAVSPPYGTAPYGQTAQAPNEFDQRSPSEPAQTSNQQEGGWFSSFQAFF